MDVNELTTKATWKIEVLSDVGVNRQVTKVTWRIENFSRIEYYKLCSEIFTVDENKWQLRIYPKGNKVDFLSIYLVVADSATLASGWSRYAHFGIAVINQFNRENSKTGVRSKEFKENEASRGFTSFLPLCEFQDRKIGYLVNDTCLVEAYVFTERNIGFISHDWILKTDKAKEADCVKAAMDSQRTTSIKPVEITNPSPAQSSSQTVAIEPEEPAKEDMNTFFTGLESELSSSRIVYSKEEAKKALAQINDALNLTPDNLNDSGKFYPLKQACMTLASFYCSSTTLTIQQKKELLAMEERLKKLADQAAKAMQDKDQLTAKESMKRTITHTLDRNLIRYKEVEPKLKQAEKNLADLHVKVEAAQKEREDMLAVRNEIFKSSKEMKMELDALAKDWVVYEAKAKDAVEEEKRVKAEWGEIKKFISSIKWKI